MTDLLEATQAYLYLLIPLNSPQIYPNSVIPFLIPSIVFSALKMSSQYFLFPPEIHI